MQFDMTNNDLMRKAGDARVQSHAPYSGYSVGAALLDEQGQLHMGCNVENAAYPEGICAETNAIGSMVTAGGKQIVTIAILGGCGDPGPCTPCGGCRQRIKEFSNDETVILLRDAEGTIKKYSISDLLPMSFSFDGN